MIARSEENDKVMYDVLLDKASGHILKLSEGAIKYVGPLSTSVAQKIVIDANVVEAEDLLEDAVDEDEEEESINLTSSRGWTAGEVYIDSRLSGSGEEFTSLNSRLIMNNGRYACLLDYFLFFFPVDHFYSIIHNTSLHARSLGHWEDINFHEYLMRIALLTVLTVARHGDRKYMSFIRFNDTMKMHVFEIPSKQAQELDPLYQIRSTIQAFNDHMAKCIISEKYHVIDESMNQWLGTDMSNLKKVPRNHIQSDKSLRRSLTITATAYCVSIHRTVIADSWFGSPDMVSMLMNHGLYSIMQVTKRRYWPQCMLETDIVESVDANYGGCFTMKKDTANGKMFVCAFRAQKVKAFVSSCGTARLTGEKTFKSSDGNLVTIKHPEVVDEY
ncbi:hypothetical protein RMCBS344292_16328 [Rhizopus microsporus]|nr:hypothetical protein RMCBS344292_16328 [Rhizopus microsporus]